MQSELDRRRLTEMQHYILPTPNPPPLQETYSHNIHTPHYSSLYTPNPIPNPNPYPPVGPSNPHEPQYIDPLAPRPVETHSHASASSLIDRYGGAYQAYAPPPQPRLIEAGPVAAPYVYYQDQNVVNTGHNWSIGIPIQQQFVPPMTMNTQVQTSHYSNNGGGKGKKKTKIVQSVWCHICKIDCNSNDMLEKHKSGKKHQKNLEKLNQAVNPIIGPPENPKKSKSRKNPPLEDQESKRRKIAEEGGMRRCSVCNVLCNSDVVFQTHLAGKKHVAAVAMMVKKNHAK